MKHPGEFFTDIIHNYCYEPPLYSDENIKMQNMVIKKLNKYMTCYNLTIHNMLSEKVPLLDALCYFAHPILIKYLKSWYYDNLILLYCPPYLKQNPLMYNKDTYVFNTKVAVKDILEWLYIRIHYGNIIVFLSHQFSKEQLIELLDEYASIFEIEYEKRNYD
jgi:hypothetical protein